MAEVVLDIVLVPIGLLLLLLYHAYLLYRVRVCPASTVIGVTHLHRRLWIRRIMADSLKNGNLAVQTLRNNILASTMVATAAFTLCSVLAALMSSHKIINPEEASVLLGDMRDMKTSLKLLCVLACFLVSLLCNVQSVWYYMHVTFLISIPICSDQLELKVDYVHKAMVRGGQFWSLGLRSLYFSFPMFMWLFGPIPMFVCTSIMIVLLHFLDTPNGFEQAPKDHTKREDIESNPECRIE